jgi:osmoprotectant transport system ATP-binding protein
MVTNLQRRGGPALRDHLSKRGHHLPVESRLDAMPASVLSLISASKRYGPALALAPTDLAIPEGQTTALIGPSGCGKTTILRLMIGLSRPDSGEVRFRDVRLDQQDLARLNEMRTRIGYVVQDGGLFPHLDAAGNVTLMARHLGWSAARMRTRLDDLVALARLPGDTLARYPAQLSGGQRQRVSLLRALMLDPEVLLLDEPLGALDPIVRAELQEDLAAIFRSLRRTVVLVTHDLAEAAFFSSDLVLLREGLIVQRGPLADLIERPVAPFVSTFVRAFRPLPGLEPQA